MEILDASLARKDAGDDDEDPGSLPLHRLAHIVSRSPLARANLESARGVTLLAPDDAALTPPDRRSGYVSDAEEHPFLHSNSLNMDEEEDEDRKARFDKIVAYIIKYHTLTVAEDGYQLADRSTVATQLASGRFEDVEPLRIRVEPKIVFMPYPHPALQFNFYSYSRGPTVIAKNGVGSLNECIRRLILTAIIA